MGLHQNREVLFHPIKRNRGWWSSNDIRDYLSMIHLFRPIITRLEHLSTDTSHQMSKNHFSLSSFYPPGIQKSTHSLAFIPPFGLTNFEYLT